MQEQVGAKLEMAHARRPCECMTPCDAVIIVAEHVFTPGVYSQMMAPL